MKYGRSTSAILAAAIVVATAAASSAFDNMYKTDNTPWNCYGETKYDATDLTITYTDAPIFEGASETDVVIQLVALPPDTLGLAYCDSVVTGSTLRCDQHFIRFTSSPMIDVYVACHEFGHTMGLTHGKEASPRIAGNDAALGCMRTPYASGTSSALGTQNATMLNQTY